MKPQGKPGYTKLVTVIYKLYTVKQVQNSILPPNVSTAYTILSSSVHQWHSVLMPTCWNKRFQTFFTFYTGITIQQLIWFLNLTDVHSLRKKWRTFTVFQSTESHFVIFNCLMPAADRCCKALSSLFTIVTHCFQAYKLQWLCNLIIINLESVAKFPMSLSICNCRWIH